MASVTFGDELVRDYLIYRGFLSALKVFDSEVKSDKDRGFRPDRIVEHLSSCITNLDLNALREAWSHLEQRVLSRLEHSFLVHAKKLENALLRMYLITCISASRHDKLLDFFEKLASELQGQSEWKEWFVLPFLKNPDENPSFSVFFTRQWQDTMLVSLHNFISVVFQSIATPCLLSYEEELIRLSTLQEENEILKSKLSSGENEPCKGNECLEVPMPAELIDDFYVIAQEAPSESTTRSFKSLIKNISSGIPSSPILGRHLSEVRHHEDYTAGGLKVSKARPRSPSVPPPSASYTSASESSSHSIRSESSKTSSIHKKDISTPEQGSRTSVSESISVLSHSSVNVPLPCATDSKSGFFILSEEEYSEHHSFITHCLFSSSGSSVASSDMDGVIKIWSCGPSTPTLSTIMSKSSVLALEWAPKREQLLFHGNVHGKARLYDTKERRIVGEAVSSSSDNQKVLSITCNPTEANFVVSTDMDSQGNISIFDMRTLQVQHVLPLPKTACYCCAFNHNGQLLLFGTKDGRTSLLDLRTNEVISSWITHSGCVLDLRLSHDENSCYTMGQDGKFSQWSINQTGHQLKDFGTHSDAVALYKKLHQPPGKLFVFNAAESHVLICGSNGGVIYELRGIGLCSATNIGANRVTTVDWSTVMECSTCLSGSSDGKIIVTTLMTK